MAVLRRLKLSGASSGESSIPKEGILNMIRSLTPQQAARNALAAEFERKSISIRFRSGLWVALTCLIVLAGCAGMGSPSPGTAVPEIRPGILMGYIPRTELPNSLSLLPPPPAPGSPAFAADQEMAREARAFRGTLRWNVAIEDANLHFPQAPAAFTCVLNAPITEKDTPRLYLLMRRTLTDAGLSTYAAKDHYNRVRPFVVNKEASCTPNEEKSLAKNGSYPSGHTAIGWAWALILTEIAPERTNALLDRGRVFGESRVICGVHWQSDVTAAKVMASGTVARLHADSTFRADLEAAKAEVAAVRAKGLPPTRDCKAEKEALAVKLLHKEFSTKLLD